MIRIDEIYNHTFWPWLEKNCPQTRMFFCDPPGYTDPEHLFNHGYYDYKENDYIFFHDQEPVDVNLYKRLFDKVAEVGPKGLGWERVNDRWIQRFPTPQNIGHIVVSERGEMVDQVCKKYQWTAHYYFYHGWACLDWYRGYYHSFLIPRARDREPTKTFISPNRIIGGRRDHRVLFLYHVFKQGLDHNHISVPKICSYENVDITTVSRKYCNTYADIEQVFKTADLPKLFEGEETQQMTSCWLSNFTEAADSLVYVPTETVYFGRRTHITEKTFKAIALEMPFVLVAPAGSLEYLREYGFKTFDGILDESYDTETDDIRRVERVAQLLKDLDDLSVRERQQIHRACLPRVEHNYNHFYHGDFGDILWRELTGMLNNLKK